MLDTTGGDSGDDEDSASESSFGSWTPLRLSATCWCRFGFQVEYDSQDHVEHCADQILQIDDAADCAGSLDLSCMKCDKRVSLAEHLHNLSPNSLPSMIKVSAEAWHAFLFLFTVTPWQYLQRLGRLFNILSRLGSISQGLACLSRFGSIGGGTYSPKTICGEMLAVKILCWVQA